MKKLRRKKIADGNYAHKSWTVTNHKINVHNFRAADPNFIHIQLNTYVRFYNAFLYALAVITYIF